MAKFSKFSSVCHTCGLCESDFSKRIHFVLHIKSHDKDHQDLYNKYLDVWLILAEAHKNLSKPGKKSMAEREQTARACEKFTEVFPLNFKRSLTRKMHVFSAVLPKHIRV